MPTFKPFFTEPSSTNSNSEQEWQSWNMRSLNQPAPSKPPTPADNAQVKTAEFAQQSELKKLQEQARTEAAEQGHAEGHKAGYDAGYAEGLAAGKAAAEESAKAELAQALAPLADLLKSADSAINSMSEQLADSLLQLAMTVGKQLAGEALAANPEQIIALIRDIIHEDPLLGERPTLVLHPQDLALVEQHMQDELASLRWKLKTDERLERGGCKLLTSQGELDATIETRWQRMLQQVRGRHA